MGLELLFELFEFVLLTLSAYWGIKVASEALTYIRIRGLLLALPPLFVIAFRGCGFLVAFTLIVMFFLVERTGVVLSLIASVFAFTLFLVGAMASTIALGILGTALHVQGYEMHGTIEELLHRAVVG